MSFEIITDSAADLTDELINSYNLNVISMAYIADDKEYPGYVKGEKADHEGFYRLARQKSRLSTSLASLEECARVLDPIAAAGKDMLYIGFSSALSGTFNNVRNYMDDLRERYPGQKFLYTDSLCASMGQGLLVYHALLKRRQGLGLEETFDWVEAHKLNTCHWFTVDDLFFLMRGGRLSGGAAVAGSILSIKPVMFVDDLGRLLVYNKPIGRKKSLDALVDAMERSSGRPEGQPVFISHGDCRADAEYVAEQVRKRMGYTDITINFIGPVIGAHSGPGTIALFFMADKR